MRDVQCRQRSRSMGASDGPTEVRICANDASLCWAGALPDAQSMIDADEGRWWNQHAPRVPQPLVNIAHFGKVKRGEI